MMRSTVKDEHVTWSAVKGEHVMWSAVKNASHYETASPSFFPNMSLMPTSIQLISRINLH